MVNRSRKILVPDSCIGMRLDRFLSRRFQTFSRTELVKGIRRSEVRDQTGKPLRAAYRLRGGDSLEITIPGLAATTDPPPFPPILHEDDRIVVVNKPAGLLAHPAGDRFVWALVGMARERWPDSEIDLVHRLDRDTSGTLVFTKDRAANDHLKKLFRENQCVKEYVAITRGVIPWKTHSCTAPIGSADSIVRIKMGVREDGNTARTDFSVLARGVDTTLVHCRLYTGRTHQIRVHLDHLGFSILGDRLYGVDPEVFIESIHTGLTPALEEITGGPRQLLHAWRIGFDSPDGTPGQFEAPLPEEFRILSHDT